MTIDRKLSPSMQPDLISVPDESGTGFASSGNEFKHLWQMAFDASPDMISILDINHRIVAVNRAMAEAMACSPEKAAGQHCYKLLHNSDRPPMACPHLALLEDGKVHQSEIYEESIDKWMLISVTPIFNDRQDLIGSIHIARDITKQKLSEQAQRESEERYHHLSEATMEGVLLSEESTIITTNQVLADMFGYSIKELNGMSLLKFVAPHDRNQLIESLRNPLVGSYRFDCIRKDGSIFPIEAHSRAVTYKGSMVYQTAIRDLTEQQRAEEEKSRHERLQGVLEMAGTVCHEINQPLMALQGFMEILESKIELTDSASKKLQQMSAQIDRINKLTTKFMRIAKYETKDYPGGEKIIDIDQAAPEDDETVKES